MGKALAVRARTSPRKPARPSKVDPGKDPRLAAWLAIWYGELALARQDDDQEAVDYIKRAIEELLRPPDRVMDRPLLPLGKPRKRAAG
jgi:hypothetical protein